MSNKTRRLILIYSVVTMIFLSILLLNQRSYQDSWILQDVFTPTVVYVLAFSMVAAMVDDVRVMALVCASFTVILNAIPNLKYNLFYGTYDSVVHYGFVEDLLSLGSVPQTGLYAPAYSDFPGMHIFLCSVSLVLGIGTSASIKLVTSTIHGIFPLMVYFITNRIFERHIRRNIILASGFPTAISYALGGTPFALPLYFSFLCVIFWRSLSREKRWEYTCVSLLLGYGLLFSHAVTMLYLLVFLSIMTLTFELFSIIKKRVLVGYKDDFKVILLILVVSFAAWQMFQAEYVFTLFVNSVKRILVGDIVIKPIPERFFELPLLAELEFFAVRHIKDALISVLSFVGFLVLVGRFGANTENNFKQFYLFVISLLGTIGSLLMFQLVVGFGYIGYGRFVSCAIVFGPFLTGLVLWYLDECFQKKEIGRIFIALFLFLCISLSLIQIFPYQPMVPRANVLSEDLPEDEYIFDFRGVNTVYMESVVSFAERFSPGDARISSDTVTRWQIYGFANHSFSSRHTRYSPLEPNATLEWDISILHYGNRSGPLNEKVEYRTRERLEKLRNTLGSVVYDNGESFIIARDEWSLVA